MSIQKKTFCKYPFTSIAPKTFEASGKLRTFWPCCMMGNDAVVDNNKLGIYEDVSDLSPLEMFEHPRMDELRENLKNGIRDKACQVCWDQEDRGLQSFRQQDLDNTTDEEIQDLAENPRVEIIDTHVNNACNLRCRMCDPSASSQLKKDNNYFIKNNHTRDLSEAVSGRWTTTKNNFRMEDVSQWQWIHDNTDKFKVLKLSGGEPFYNPKVIDFLHKCIANGTNKNITLEFHTNGTLFDSGLLFLLEQFETNFNISIDGQGKTYEYVRYPMSWNQLNFSIRNFVKKIKPQHLHISFIPMIYNIFNIKDFVTWGNSLDTQILYHWAEVYPEDRGVSLIHLPIDLLEKAKEQLAFLEDDQLVNIIQDAIIRNDEDKEKALLEITLFDKSRNQNFEDYLDEDIVKWLKT